MSTSELAVSYAALILADDGVDITPDKLCTILKAADVDVEPIWAQIFAKALEGKNVKDMLTAAGSGGAAAATTTAPVPGGGDAPTAPEVKPEVEEEKEESDEDMGFGLFD
ncbi:hypothetical protein Egran_06625 [Elaphomyces granulatus]|uniref:Large ribosomal subunit protein P1 n=1 Tax=Elaphomyces granulatus TaxID=519963 RepID=A0A232LP70_9EURO|nr:hypothetical protein Egran_06625 [Elaphomyces granulatus]